MTLTWPPATAQFDTLETHLRDLGWGVRYSGAGRSLRVTLTSPDGQPITSTTLRAAYESAREYEAARLALALNWEDVHV